MDSLISVSFVATIAVAVMVIRAASLILSTVRNHQSPPPGGHVRTLVVLGSGGHTAEMMALTKHLPSSRYSPVFYVVAGTDSTSVAKVEALRGSPLPEERVFRIPRSREVGQSYVSSLFSTGTALLWAIVLVCRIRPRLILANGPGTCMPICAAGFLWRLMGVLDCRIVFAESFCRVKSLSLTGKILYPIVDRFVVQWPQLVQRYPRAEYIGDLC